VTERPILEALRVTISTLTSTGTSTARDATLAPIAIGWATVESDRAIAELVDALALDASAFLPATGSAVLGSFVLVASGVLDGAVDLAVVEPSTEGRLTAHLARHGEGPTVAWLAASTMDSTNPGTSGPFGSERLLAPQPDGLLRLLVATAPGTITR
jgi:hypothetical protein